MMGFLGSRSGLYKGAAVEHNRADCEIRIFSSWVDVLIKAEEIIAIVFALEHH